MQGETAGLRSDATIACVGDILQLIALGSGAWIEVWRELISRPNMALKGKLLLSSPNGSPRQQACLLGLAEQSTSF